MTDRDPGRQGADAAEREPGEALRRHLAPLPGLVDLDLGDLDRCLAAVGRYLQAEL